MTTRASASSIWSWNTWTPARRSGSLMRTYRPALRHGQGKKPSPKSFAEPQLPRMAVALHNLLLHNIPLQYHWAIVGDLNVDAGTIMKWCQPFLKNNVPCLSTSGWPRTRDAQKSDIALLHKHYVCCVYKSVEVWLEVFLVIGFRFARP